MKKFALALALLLVLCGCNQKEKGNDNQNSNVQEPEKFTDIFTYLNISTDDVHTFKKDNQIEVYSFKTSEDKANDYANYLKKQGFTMQSEKDSDRSYYEAMNKTTTIKMTFVKNLESWKEKNKEYDIQDDNVLYEVDYLDYNTDTTIKNNDKAIEHQNLFEYLHISTDEVRTLKKENKQEIYCFKNNSTDFEKKITSYTDYLKGLGFSISLKDGTVVSMYEVTDNYVTEKIYLISNVSEWKKENLEYDIKDENFVYVVEK